MKRIYIFLLCLSFYVTLFSQTTYQRPLHDNIWITDYAKIDFSQSPPLLEANSWPSDFDATNASLCDTEGNLLAFSNGMVIANAQNEIMENGDSINTGPLIDYYISYNATFPWPQMMIALPKPEIEDTFLFFHLSPYELDEPNEHLNIFFSELYYSEIIFNDIHPNGYVHTKNQLISDSLMSPNKLTAIRHANGQDWWVVMPKYGSTEYLRFLLTPDGIVNYPPALVADTIVSGLGQACFSPDGTLYARLDFHQLGGDQYLNLMDFDRCSGTFSNQRQYIYRDTALLGGLAFSENSRFLYVGSFMFLYQFDMEAEDILSSKTVIGTVDEIDYVGYYQGQLAPDGKVYIAPAGNSPGIHIVHHPNRRAPACDFEYLGLRIEEQFYRRSIPNHPYYGLGPLDGSLCDTLQINNPVPTAAFEYWQSDSTGTFVEFFDGSFYAYEWSWDFGDQSVGSSQRHPVHNYAQPGVYEVCLTATNPAGSHSFCQMVDVNIVDLNSILLRQLNVQLSPNPVQNQLILSISEPIYEDLRLILYTTSGQQMGEWVIPAGSQNKSINMVDFPPALYFYQIESAQHSLLWAKGKVMKM